MIAELTSLCLGCITWLTIKEISAIDYRKSQYQCEGPGSVSIAIATAKTYVHSGGTDVIWVLSLQNHTPPVHWAQCTQPCEKNAVQMTVEIPGRNSIERFFLWFLWAVTALASAGLGLTFSSIWHSTEQCSTLCTCITCAHECCIETQLTPNWCSNPVPLDWVLLFSVCRAALNSLALVWVSPHITDSRMASWMKMYWSCVCMFVCVEVWDVNENSHWSTLHHPKGIKQG